MKQMFKNKGIVKKMVAGALALVSLGTIRIYDAQMKKNVDLGDGIAKTSQSDNLLNLFDKKKDGIAVLEVGNHKTVNTSFQDTKLYALEKMGVDTAIIINCDTEELYDIYDDVAYAKSILAKHDINLPVYMDVNKIMENMDINNNDKKELISTFLEKCSANGFYVGVYGTDTNLCRLKDYVYPEIVNYDALVELDSDEIKYDGTYNMYQKDGCFILRDNDLEVIKEKGFNEKKRFVNDVTYKYENEEKLQEYLFVCGLSKKELKKYNDQIFLNKGDILKVPQFMQITDNTNSIGYVKVEEPLLGCDISSNQSGTEEDWKKLFQNVDFVIARTSTGYSEDKSFNDFYVRCIKNDMPFGAYTMIDYTKIGCPTLEEYKDKQGKTSNKTLELLKNKKVTLPVYIDIENPYNADSEYYGCHPKVLFDKEYIEFMLDDWYTKMSGAGYIPGIYANKEYIDYISECVDYELSDKFEIWIAGGEEYNVEKDYDKYEITESYKNYEGSTMYQVTQYGQNAGIGNHEGYLDIDYSELDYSKPVYEDSETEEVKEIKEFNRVDSNALGLSILGLAGASGLFINSKKKRRKNCK